MHDETAGKERIDLVFAQARENLLLQGVALGLQDNDGGADEDTESAGRLGHTDHLSFLFSVRIGSFVPEPLITVTTMTFIIITTMCCVNI